METPFFMKNASFSKKKSPKYLEGIKKSHTFALAFGKEVSS